MNHSVKSGTAAGTMLCLLGSINWGDIEKTLVLAAIGAIVSFMVSHGLKRLLTPKRSNFDVGNYETQSI